MIVFVCFYILKSSFCLNLLTRKNTYRGNRQYFVLSLSTKFLTRKNQIELATSQSNFFLYQIFFLYLTKQEKYIFLYLLYIQGWALIFPLLDIKLCFLGLLFRNAKMVSFFFVRKNIMWSKRKRTITATVLYSNI